MAPPSNSSTRRPDQAMRVPHVFEAPRRSKDRGEIPYPPEIEGGRHTVPAVYAATPAPLGLEVGLWVTCHWPSHTRRAGVPPRNAGGGFWGMVGFRHGATPVSGLAFPGVGVTG